MEDSLINILYLDDEINNLTMFKATFRFDYNIHIALSAEEARKILIDHEINIIITDQKMPGTSGVEFLCSILDKYPDSIRILLTGYADMDAVVNAINKGQIYQYISKPWDEQNLKMVIQKAYEVFSLRRENKELIKKLLQANKQMEFLLRQKLIS
jgi:response regulator RpfG family c-di-GMP phosphodiesterase